MKVEISKNEVQEAIKYYLVNKAGMDRRFQPETVVFYDVEEMPISGHLIAKVTFKDKGESTDAE